MKCVVCKQGETRQGTTTLTLERQGATIIVKSVPAQVCENCDEAYIDDEVSRRVLETARNAAEAGVEVDIREYVVSSSV